MNTKKTSDERIISNWTHVKNNDHCSSCAAPSACFACSLLCTKFE